MRLGVLVLAGAVLTACASGPAQDRGYVSLSCAVAADRRLEDCRIVGERPAGAGFGEAALRAAQDPGARAPTTARVGDRITTNIDFRPVAGSEPDVP